MTNKLWTPAIQNADYLLHSGPGAKNAAGAQNRIFQWKHPELPALGGQIILSLVPLIHLPILIGPPFIYWLSSWNSGKHLRPPQCIGFLLTESRWSLTSIVGRRLLMFRNSFDIIGFLYIHTNIGQIVPTCWHRSYQSGPVQLCQIPGCVWDGFPTSAPGFQRFGLALVVHLKCCAEQLIHKTSVVGILLVG